MQLDAGARNRRVTFQRFIKTGTDDYGADILEWVDHAVRWVAVSFGTGQERREAAQESASSPATFWAPADSATRLVTVVDRIKFDGADWNISSISPVGFNEGIEFAAIRAVP